MGEGKWVKRHHGGVIHDDTASQTDHPEEDQFIEGKIGSGYMSTIEGQPHLEDSASGLLEGHVSQQGIRGKSQGTPDCRKK